MGWGSSIGAGRENKIKGSTASVIGGGERNVIYSNATDSVIAGGADNVILTNTQLATISGGYQNLAGAAYATVAGGINNNVQTNASTSTIGGGNGNSIQPDAGQSTIAGGYYNSIHRGAAKASVGGGHGNLIKSNAVASTIAGGYQNTSESYAAVGGGAYNNAVGSSATIAGGSGNTASGYTATVPGGLNNNAGGAFSFAAGRRAKAVHDGSFVWGDATDADFNSTAPGQFLIRADRVGIGTATPQQKLHVNGGYALVQGLGDEQAYLGGDGLGGDVQLGSMNPNIQFVSLWNPSANTRMDLVGREIYWAGSGLTRDQGGAIELGDSTLANSETPYIDFRYGNGSGEDYNVRLINDTEGQLSCWGTFSTCVLKITGGCDISEPFAVSSANITKGAVVVIDEKNPGALRLSDQPYDRRVAGVVSGANGINPGLILSQKGVLDGEQQVALTGRVYVQADASTGAIEPGDLLTTSATPGHAMKVTDHAQAPGAVLGKAMSALKEGQGLVLVLVSLQ